MTMGNVREWSYGPIFTILLIVYVIGVSSCLIQPAHFTATQEKGENHDMRYVDNWVLNLIACCAIRNKSLLRGC
jgi:hypothetical protein